MTTEISVFRTAEDQWGREPSEFSQADASVKDCHFAFGLFFHSDPSLTLFDVAQFKTA
jgi:hypothetical protein